MWTRPELHAFARVRGPTLSFSFILRDIVIACHTQRCDGRVVVTLINDSNRGLALATCFRPRSRAHAVIHLYLRDIAVAPHPGLRGLALGYMISPAFAGSYSYVRRFLIIR